MAKRYTLTTQNRAGFTAHVGSIPTPGTMLKKIEINRKDIDKLFVKDTPMAKFYRSVARTIKQVIFLLFLFGVFFVILNSSAFVNRLTFFFHNQTPIVLTTPEPTGTNQTLTNYDPTIEIPAISVKAPIVMNVDPNDMLNKLKEGVAQYNLSATPGQAGNVVLVGHSSDYPWSNGKYKTVFTLLDKLKVGDSIFIPYGTEIYEYQVTNSKVVAATEISVLVKTDDPTLTLITCYPVGTSQKRLIITAKLTKGTITGTQTTNPLTDSLPAPR